MPVRDNRTNSPIRTKAIVVIAALLAGTACPLRAQDVDEQKPWLELVARGAQPADAGWPPGLLMDGLGAAGARNLFDLTGLRIWGFVEAGFTGRLIGGQKTLPGRLFDARRVNDLRLNQLRLTVERPYDSAKAFDIGGRADVLYGGDAMYTRALGLDKLGSGAGENWFDPLQFYLQPWLKTGRDSGIEFTIGKFCNTMGYETVDAPFNPLYSHSYLFNTMGPFTVTGAQATYYFNEQWSAYFGVVNGWDDFRDNNHAVSYVAGGGWSSAGQLDGHSRSIASLNVMTGPEQPGNVHNYRTVADGIFTHWWTRKLSQTVNADWATEEKATDAGGVARWYGAAHYLSYVFNDYCTGVWRAEWFCDDTGIITGTAPASWYEMTWGATLTPWPGDKILKNLSFRPEFRWDFADKPVFGGGRENQLTLAVDVIFKF